MNSPLSSNLRYLKGIGEKKAELFAKLGVVTVGALLSYFPYSYERWIPEPSIQQAELDKTLCVKGVIASSCVDFGIKKNKRLLKVLVTDGPGLMELAFFNAPYVADQLLEGKEFLFYGKITLSENGMLQMISPKFQKTENALSLYPKYHQTAGLNSKAIASAVKTAMELYSHEIPEILPAEQVNRFKLPTEKDAVQMIHFPENEAQIKAARRRLIYEELLVLQLGLKMNGSKLNARTPYVLKKDYSECFEQSLPFTLTNAQKRTIRECMACMQGYRPMRRLVQGDVGSGKTAVAASLIYSVAKSGYQSVMMAPTEVLARQHYNTFLHFYENSEITVELLTGSTKAAKRRDILQRLKNGEISLLIGTHAVLTKDVEFADLALCVTDEQHRFGVNQRALLRSKGNEPHVLVMSATPIPRTLSLIIYGDLDISVLDEKPKGRKPIKTYRVTSDYHQRIYTFIKKQLDEGASCYLVCPNVEDNPDGEEEDINSKKDRLSAVQTAMDLSQNEFKDYQTAVLHGKMKQAEKDDIMLRFSNGEIQLLICTVVIEVGIDVPKANTIVIENAECFGLSQLHQLRGRTGRGERQSYCILISDADNEEALKRFDVMCKTNDGFIIAEEDLKLRGPGDFFGNRQSGLPTLKIANLMGDTKILYTARDEADKILQQDAQLLLPQNQNLRNKAQNLFADIS